MRRWLPRCGPLNLRRPTPPSAPWSRAPSYTCRRCRSDGSVRAQCHAEVWFGWIDGRVVVNDRWSRTLEGAQPEAWARHRPDLGGRLRPLEAECSAATRNRSATGESIRRPRRQHRERRPDLLDRAPRAVREEVPRKRSPAGASRMREGCRRRQRGCLIGYHTDLTPARATRSEQSRRSALSGTRSEQSPDRPGDFARRSPRCALLAVACVIAVWAELGRGAAGLCSFGAASGWSCVVLTGDRSRRGGIPSIREGGARGGEHVGLAKRSNDHRVPGRGRSTLALLVSRCPNRRPRGGTRRLPLRLPEGPDLRGR